MQREYPIGSVKTAFDIVECLVEMDGGGVTDIASRLDVPKSTVHDYLNTLRKMGYVVQSDGQYRVSYRLLELGERHRHAEPLVEFAADELSKLAAETDVYASLVVEENGEAVIVDTRKGEESGMVTVYNGIRMKMHAGAAGKAILAYLPEERVEEIIDIHGLKGYTPNTMTDRDVLFEELATVREDGVALDDEERIAGMRSVAVPIIDRTETVLGSITVYGPSQYIDDTTFEEKIPQKLLKSSNVIEVMVNYE